MAESASPRKLASIVAIDVAGYSRRTEADEEAAVNAIAALRQKVAKAAATHGGRVFNTAGDGFMLEFPSASSALAAAEEISAAGDPPVRAGVHLGDVNVTDGGDLLGHGVNVAARIQQMASPGAVLVSGDVKRAIRGPLADRLKPQGSVKLDKMSETLPVFALAPAEGGRAKGRRRNTRAAVTVGALAAALVVLGLAAWLGPRVWQGAEPREPRVAILPFDTLGQASGLHDFADGLRDQILSVMSSNELQTVSRSDSEALRAADGSQKVEQLGITLLLDGAIESGGKTLSVRVHLDDPRRHVTLWTTSLDQESSDRPTFQRRIADKVTNVLMCAADLQHAPSAPRDSDTLVLFLHACDLSENMEGDLQRREQVLDALRTVTMRAPGFARGHSKLASVQADRYRYLPQDQGAQRFQEASREARRALAIDPNDSAAYEAQSLLQPVTAFAEREQLLLQGLARAPSDAQLSLRYAQFLPEVGRLGEAETFAKRAAAHAPLVGHYATYVPYFEAAGGDFIQARAGIDEVSRTWPDFFGWWGFSLSIAEWAGQTDQALAILNRAPAFVSAEEIDHSRGCVLAMKSHSPVAVAAVARREEARSAVSQQDVREAIDCLSTLGLVDAAFAISERYQPNIYLREGSAMFFFPPTAAMRRDPRFMKLAGRIGLVDYWRSSGKWPDFCAEPGLPYNCKAEAAKLRSEPAR